MATSTEHTESVREMFTFLKTQTAAAETNNVAHATVTTNAWRDAVDMIPKTAGSLDTLLLQLGASAAPIVSQVGGVAIVKDSLAKLKGMKLVFDSATRQMLLKKAVTALTNLETSLNKLGAQTGGEWGASKSVPAGGAGAGAGALSSAAPHAASSSNSSQSSGTGLYRPMPEIQKATIVFDPANMRTGPSANNGDTTNHNIKPVNKMTFSSAESSASARLGVAGKCAICNAHREVGSPVCPSCGKNSNIIF